MHQKPSHRTSFTPQRMKSFLSRDEIGRLLVLGGKIIFWNQSNLPRTYFLHDFEGLIVCKKVFWQHQDLQYKLSNLPQIQDIFTFSFQILFNTNLSTSFFPSNILFLGRLDPLCGMIRVWKRASAHHYFNETHFSLKNESL